MTATDFWWDGKGCEREREWAVDTLASLLCPDVGDWNLIDGVSSKASTPFRTSMASNIKSFPAASLKTASSNSQSNRFLPVPPKSSGITCNRITAHNASKNGLVPGIPTVHQFLMNRSTRSCRSFCARVPRGLDLE